MFEKWGGAKGARTPDLLVANQMLFQLSYSPVRTVRLILSGLRGTHRFCVVSP